VVQTKIEAQDVRPDFAGLAQGVRSSTSNCEAKATPEPSAGAK
jgi:hypothetical protein